MGSGVDDFLNFLADRRSIRRFKPGRIEEELLRTVIEAARWAPSAHNRQPWRFVVVTDPEVKLHLAQAMAGRLRRDRVADGDEEDVIAADVKRSVARLQQAAAVVVVFLTMESMDRYSDERRSRLEQVMAAQSTAMAGQNMLLMAHRLGLGACWVCAPLFADDEAINVLDCPPEWQPQGLIMLGWTHDVPAARERKSVEEISQWI